MGHTILGHGFLLTRYHNLHEFNAISTHEYGTHTINSGLHCEIYHQKSGIAPLTRDVSCEIELLTQTHLHSSPNIALIAPMHRRSGPSKKKVTNNYPLLQQSQQHPAAGPSGTISADWLIPVPQSSGGRPVQGRNGCI